MNRLIIIGNGFDLAHGLPTGYCDFIDDYWRNVIRELLDKEIYNDNLIRINISHLRLDTFTKAELRKEIFDYKTLMLYIDVWYDDELIEKQIKNVFFQRICGLHSNQNWVEIENEYYDVLKDCLRNNKSIIDLNKQFDQVKLLLQDYLIKNVQQAFKFSFDEAEEMTTIFNNNIYSGQSLEDFYLELPKKDEKEFEKTFEREKNALASTKKWQSYRPSIRIRNHFLSFNYTSTVSEYNNALGNDLDNLIEIHGLLLDIDNPINFGFGDEMDKHYQEIEEKNDNEYLRNIKSFQYLHTPNYKRLLDLIDSDKFQVYIMGHSCGLSDRTLLNTIFEHENCISIKVFFHEIKDEEGKVIKDNYTEITQNISRHFNKKKLMREKIVNKTLCQPLPQIKLPKKNEIPPLSE